MPPKRQSSHRAAAAAAREILLANHEKTWTTAAALNKRDGRRGMVMVSKLRYIRAAPHASGYYSVFPCIRHGDHTDGFDVPKLSPAKLGPVYHGMKSPGTPSIPFPTARNLENFFQFAKVFPSEQKDGVVPRSCIDERYLAYQDHVAHRQKPAAAMSRGSPYKNVPMFSLFWDAQGQEHRFTYIESRWFYCVWYERLARARPEFDALCDLVQRGINLNIIGYDGYDVRGKTMRECYEDVFRPFGHELVLYSLLTGGDNGVQPWDAYANERPELYSEFKTMFEKKSD